MNEAYILMDRSGSMSSMWGEAIDGVNEFVKKLDDVNVKFTIFDDISIDVVRNCHASNWDPVTTNEISPRGWTPLLDASGRAMTDILAEKPERAVLVIVTDGYENASREFTKDSVKALIEKMNKANYEIVYLGANFDKVEDVAHATLGVQNNAYNNSRIMSTTRAGFASAMGATATASADYFTKGVRADTFYSEVDRVKAAAK